MDWDNIGVHTNDLPAICPSCRQEVDLGDLSACPECDKVVCAMCCDRHRDECAGLLEE